MIEGFLNNPDALSSTHLYYRNIVDIEENLKDKKAGLFLDITDGKEVDGEAQVSIK